MISSNISTQLLRLRKLWGYLSSRRHKQFALLLVLVIVASLAEIVSIGLVLPFLGVLASPETIYFHPMMQDFICLINDTYEYKVFSEPEQLILPVTLVFVSISVVSGVVRVLLVYVTTRLSFATGADISINMYRRTLYQDYMVHNSRNSSEVINSIITKSNTVINGVISPALNFISSITITISIITALVIIDPSIAISAFLGFGLLYLIVIYLTRKQLVSNSTIVADHSTEMIRSLQEGLGGIRDVIIYGSQEYYCRMYRKSDLMLRRASGNNVFIGQSPRYAMESIGMVIISTLAYATSLQGKGLETAIPVLGALALGAQKLLPALQQLYNSYSQLKGSHASFRDVLDLLEQPLPYFASEPLPTPIPFNKEIKLKNVSFYYDSNKQRSTHVLNNINLNILKGDCIGFVGETGSGKSTLLDIIMLLINQTKGDFFVDGRLMTIEDARAWQMNIAHVSQDIHLSDSTIEENIAFGVRKEKINFQRVVEAARQAEIDNTIESFPDKYKTFVGERGVRLSGGQKQRIGIARALYKQAEVLVFDEATSALDVNTEKAVMESIKKLNKNITIFMIAHRLSTLESCNKIVKIEEGHVECVGSYQDILQKY